MAGVNQAHGLSVFALELGIGIATAVGVLVDAFVVRSPHEVVARRS